MSVLWVTTYNLGPYHYAMVSSIVPHIPDFKVLRISRKKEVDRPWVEDLVTAAPCEIDTVPVGKGITPFLRKHNPKLILVNGYYGYRFLHAALWGRLKRVPVILGSDTWIESSNRQGLTGWFKSVWVRSMYSGAFVPGKRGADYMRRLGIPAKNIWKPLYIIDTAHFAKPQKENGRFQLPNSAAYFLTVSRLSEEKNISGLLDGFAQYRRAGGQWELAIAGRGPQGNWLKSQVPDDVAKYVHWLGWVSYHDLPSVYQAAACFILASIRERWGQVVSEAMAAGLPLIISNKCGCAPELCHEGQNGFQFDPYDTSQLAELMKHISSSDQIVLDEMGNKSRCLVSGYSPSNWADAVLDMYQRLADESSSKFPLRVGKT